MAVKKKQLTNRATVLKGYVDEGVKLEQEIQAAVDKHVAPLREARKDLLAAAKGEGFQAKAVRVMVKEKLMEYELKAELMMYREMLAEEDENPLS